jgi:hypothetical protein
LVSKIRSICNEKGKEHNHDLDDIGMKDNATAIVFVKGSVEGKDGDDKNSSRDHGWYKPFGDR